MTGTQRRKCNNVKVRPITFDLDSVPSVGETGMTLSHVKPHFLNLYPRCIVYCHMTFLHIHLDGHSSLCVYACASRFRPLIHIKHTLCPEETPLQEQHKPGPTVHIQSLPHLLRQQCLLRDCKRSFARSQSSPTLQQCTRAMGVSHTMIQVLSELSLHRRKLLAVMRTFVEISHGQFQPPSSQTGMSLSIEWP